MASNASLVIKTPSGKIVPASSYIVDNPEFSCTEITQVTNQFKNTYPKATVLRNASNVYNCHSYAWYKQSLPNRVWLKLNIAYTTDTDSYTSILVGGPAKNDKVAYSTLHSGIVVSGSGIPTVKSKWGSGPLMQHSVLYVPSSYGKNITYYRLK